jgi:hypothetical protein
MPHNHDLFTNGIHVVEYISETENIVHVKLHGGLDNYISRGEFYNDYHYVYAIDCILNT